MKHARARSFSSFSEDEQIDPIARAHRTTRPRHARSARMFNALTKASTLRRLSSAAAAVASRASAASETPRGLAASASALARERNPNRGAIGRVEANAATYISLCNRISNTLLDGRTTRRSRLCVRVENNAV